MSVGSSWKTEDELRCESYAAIFILSVSDFLVLYLLNSVKMESSPRSQSLWSQVGKTWCLAVDKEFLGHFFVPCARRQLLFTGRTVSCGNLSIVLHRPDKHIYLTSCSWSLHQGTWRFALSYHPRLFNQDIFKAQHLSSMSHRMRVRHSSYRNFRRKSRDALSGWVTERSYITDVRMGPT